MVAHIDLKIILLSSLWLHINKILNAYLEYLIEIAE